MKIIAALAVFCVLIITHELGHFAVAKMSGIYVYSFNLGMGPKLFSFTKGETEYTIRLLPLGGSVMMMGEDDDTCDDDPRSFNRQAVWKRICTIAAGPLMNFVTAIVLFIIVFMMLGTASDANIIGGVIEGSAAEAAGLQAGDQILYIGDYLIEKWNDISPAIAAAGAGNPLDIVFLRDGVQQQLTLQPYFDELSGNWMIGIQSSVARQSLSTAIKLGFMQTSLFTKEIIVTLGAMILGKTAVELSGPVGIV
ncbi:MAG: site-2 protease family protein, partial [Firmicutes bacterium]|nr:site-2 protease family protein [Bacillota bacterium]